MRWERGVGDASLAGWQAEEETIERTEWQASGWMREGNTSGRQARVAVGVCGNVLCVHVFAGRQTRTRPSSVVRHEEGQPKQGTGGTHSQSKEAGRGMDGLGLPTVRSAKVLRAQVDLATAGTIASSCTTDSPHRSLVKAAI